MVWAFCIASVLCVLLLTYFLLYCIVSATLSSPGWLRLCDYFPPWCVREFHAEKAQSYRIFKRDCTRVQAQITGRILPSREHLSLHMCDWCEENATSSFAVPKNKMQESITPFITVNRQDIHGGDIHGGDIHTAENAHEKTYTHMEEHTYGGTYIRKNIHTEETSTRRRHTL